MHQEGPIIFETARLVVRQYRPDDQENFFAMNGDEEIVRYIRPAKTKEESDIFLAEVIGYYFENPLYGRWAVNEKQTGNFVGTFALIPIEKTSKMQLGYSLLKPAWGQGYATELTKAGLMYVFSKTPLSEIWGITEAGNIPSQKVLLKAGFKISGSYMDDGKEIFSYLFSKHDVKNYPPVN